MQQGEERMAQEEVPYMLTVDGETTEEMAAGEQMAEAGSKSRGSIMTSEGML